MSKSTQNWKSHLLGHHEFRELSIDDLFVDPTYQRDLNQPAITRYVHDFDANLFEPLTVNERKNGSKPTYALLDGQHRKAVAHRMGNRTVTCRILHVDQATEADLFVRLNHDRLHLSPVGVFKAELAARNPACIEIMKVLEARNLSVAKDEDTQTVSAVVTLKKIYARGGFVRLGRVLDTIILTWPEDEPSRFVGNLMLGLDDFLHEAPVIDITALSEKLSTSSPQRILYEANKRWHGHRALGETKKSVVNCVSESIGIIYRKRKS